MQAVMGRPGSPGCSRRGRFHLDLKVGIRKLPGTKPALEAWGMGTECLPETEPSWRGDGGDAGSGLGESLPQKTL